MAINFPSSPATNDSFISPSGIEYIYDGVKWRLFKSAESVYANASNIGSGMLSPAYGGAVVNTSTTASWSPPANVMYFGLMAIDTTLLNVAASYGSGRVGHFSVYNSALTAAGVGQNYAAGLGMYA